MQDQIESKRQELNALRKINILTETMKKQLELLAVQVEHMHGNAESVSQVMKNWDSIVRSISQASLSLLQYAEGDYEVGVWNNTNSSDTLEKDPPLPETLVRVRVDDEKEL